MSAPTSDSSRASADRALLPRPQRPQRAASVTTIPAAAAAAARGGGTAKSSVAASPLALKRCASLPPTLAPEVVPIPCEEVQHLPVFSWLSRGVPARTVTPPFPGRTSAEGECFVGVNCNEWWMRCIDTGICDLTSDYFAIIYNVLHGYFCASFFFPGGAGGVQEIYYESFT